MPIASEALPRLLAKRPVARRWSCEIDFPVADPAPADVVSAAESSGRVETYEQKHNLWNETGEFEIEPEQYETGQNVAVESGTEHEQRYDTGSSGGKSGVRGIERSETVDGIERSENAVGVERSENEIGVERSENGVGIERGEIAVGVERSENGVGIERGENAVGVEWSENGVGIEQRETVRAKSPGSTEEADADSP